MKVDDIEVARIEIEKVVGENYPKGWKFINQDGSKVKRVQPYVLAQVGVFKTIESVYNADLTPDQKLVGIYGWQNDYGFANIGFIVKEATLQ